MSAPKMMTGALPMRASVMMLPSQRIDCSTEQRLIFVPGR